MDFNDRGGGAGRRREEGSRRPALAEVEEEWARAGVAAARAQWAQASLYSVLICGYLEKGWMCS